MSELSPSRIVCSAIRDKAGRLFLGPRHGHCFQAANEFKQEDSFDEYEQGFIDQHNKFLTREEAWIIAEKNGQIFRRCGGDGKKLFSENLY